MLLAKPMKGATVVMVDAIRVCVATFVMLLRDFVVMLIFGDSEVMFEVDIVVTLERVRDDTLMF